MCQPENHWILPSSALNSKNENVRRQRFIDVVLFEMVQQQFTPFEGNASYRGMRLEVRLSAMTEGFVDPADVR